MTSFLQLCNKEVVSIKTGARLGFVDDVEFDETTTQIKKLIIFGRGKAFGIMGREQDLYINWEDIATYGEDIILVRCEHEFIYNRARRKHRSFL